MAHNTYVKTASGWEQIASNIQAVPSGLAPIVPTSVINGSYTSDGQISFTAQTSITINGIFSNAYDNYFVQFVGQSSINGAILQARFASGGTIATADSWAYGGNSLNTTAIAFNAGSASATVGVIGPLSNNNATANYTRIEISAPFLASEKIIQSQNVGHTTQYTYWSSDSTLTSRDGLNLVMASGTFTGTVRVYGYSKSSIQSSQEIIQSPNYLLNGNFSVWQRGTSFVADGYCADRWYFDETGTCTVDQEVTEVPLGFQYSLKAVATTVSDSADIYQCLESAVVIPLRGKTVTFSFYLKCGADFITNTTNTSIIGAYYNTTTDARISQTTTIGTLAITPSDYAGWSRASYTFNVPTNALGLKVGFFPGLTNVSPYTSTYYITGAMLEVGSSATSFRTNTNTTPQAEADACKAYYERFSAVTAEQASLPADAHSTVTGRCVGTYSVAKRVIPTITLTGGPDTLRMSMNGTDAQIDSANVTINANNLRTFALEFTTTGLTAGNGTYVYVGAAVGAKIEISAEL